MMEVVTHQHDSDELLLLSTSNGSTEAFNELYKRYGQKMFSYFFRMLWKNKELAEDLTQELFIKIIKNAINFNIEKSFSTWVYSIANNMCKNEYRKAATIMKHKNIQADESIMNTEKNTDLQKFKIAVANCIDELPEEKKTLFILRFEEHLSIPNISNILNIPEGTIKSRLFYLLKELKEQLSPYKTLHIYP